MTIDDVISFVYNVQMPELTKEKMHAVLAEAAKDAVDAHGAASRAHKAAIAAGIESQVVIASEKLRHGAWEHMWPSTQVEAMELSWVLARLGTALATADLVGTNGYTIEDYAMLVKPWAAGFPAFPIPTREGER